MMSLLIVLILALSDLAFYDKSPKKKKKRSTENTERKRLSKAALCSTYRLSYHMRSKQAGERSIAIAIAVMLCLF